jgi:hypothetical protein
MSDQVRQTDRKSTRNTESTLGLAAASNVQRSGFETSNEKNNLQSTKIIITKRLGSLVSFCSQILKEGQLLRFDLSNFNKTHFMQFMAKPKLPVDIHISCKVNPINNSCSTNFLDLTLSNTLSWKTHIDRLSPELNSAGYIIGFVRSVISMKKLRTIYFSYVHSIITYGIIFCGNSTYSNNIFKLQKRAIRIIMNASNRVL